MKTSNQRVWFLFHLLSGLFLANLSAQSQIVPLALIESPPIKQLGHHPITCHERVWNLAFSPDGQKLYSVGDTVMSHEWRKPGQRRYLWAPGENESMFHTVFSPDRSMFARLENGKNVQIHRTKDGTKIQTLEGDESGSLEAGSWGPFGKRFVTGGEAEIILWDVASGKSIQKIPQGKGRIATVAISPDGKKIVAGNRDSEGTEGLLFLHQIDGSLPPLQLEEGTGWSSRIPMVFAPDGKTLAGPAEFKGRSSFCIWDVETGKVIHRFQGGFNHAAFSSDGRWVATGGLNRLQIWNAVTGEEIFKHQAESINQHIWSVTFTFKGDVLAAGIGKSIRFFDTKTWNVINPSDTHHTPILTTAFSNDGKFLVTGDMEGRLVLWDWQKKTKIWINTELAHLSLRKIEERKDPIRVHAWGISALSISPDNRLIAVCANAGRYENRRVFDSKAFSIIERKSGKVTTSFGTGGGAKRGIIISHDNKVAYTGSHTGTIDAWEIATGELIRKIGTPLEPGHEHSIVALRFADDSGQAIWWNGEHHKLAKRRLSDGEDTVILSGGSETARGGIHLPSHGNWLASGKTYWLLPEGELKKPFHRHESFRMSERPHPSGLISVASSDESALLVDMLSGKPMAQINLGPGEIRSLTFSPNGESLVAAGDFGIKYLECSTLDRLPGGEKAKVAQLWEFMGSAHPWQAYQAAWALAKKPNSLEFIKNKLQPAIEPSPAEQARLRAALKDPDGKVASTAARMLLDMGISLTKEDLELLRRPDENFGSSIALPSRSAFDLDPSSLEPVLGPIPELLPLAHRSRITRALMLLQSDGSSEALDVLHRMSEGFPSSPVTRQARQAIERIQ